MTKVVFRQPLLSPLVEH